jgi:hypothetical protein
MKKIRPKMKVPRLSEDEMREIVAKRLSRQVMFSDEVTPQSMHLVFLPLAMGGLAPPDELRKALMGSTAPPESLEGEPPKPEKPSYPDLPDAPEKPLMDTIDPEAQRLFDWGDMDADDYEAIAAKVKAVNDARIKEWMDRTLDWDKSLDVRQDEVRRLDEAYEQAIKDWQDSIEDFPRKEAEREAARQAWVAEHDAIFSEWGSDVGVLMGDMDDSFPRGINGYPMFSAMQVIHKDDWDRIRTSIIREQDREIAI